MEPNAELARPDYVKVQMSSGDGATETAWAVRIAPGRDHFRLDNAPFFAYRVSADDVVEGRFLAEGVYDFVRVVEPSGNRTVRLMFDVGQADSAAGKSVLAGVVALGCSYEGMISRIVSITVPSAVELGVVGNYLTATGLNWEYADPTYEDLFGDGGPT